MLKFFDELRKEKENIKYFFGTKDALEKATQGCGKPGGHIAFLLCLFCRYYGNFPRNVNVVHSKCGACNSDNKKCGTLKKCGGYYGCGKGVVVPFEPGFDVKTIPQIRADIKTEDFPHSLIEG